MIIAGLYSSRGASHALLKAFDSGSLKMVISTALIFEYEDLLRRKQELLELADNEIEAALNQFCAKAECRRVHFLWRPRLTDAADDHLVELAMAAGGIPIATHNLRRFQGLDDLGIKIMSPQQMLKELS
ncbi:PIN domain-containing protein [bacterium]|nr:PIN domain-containing protein [bacterium]MDA7667748.1 PIN domain-containing protein [bacterium]